MIRRKTKMVSFRVSPDEYHQLREACEAQGVESVSELARVAMFGVIRRERTKAPVDQQIGELRERVRHLAAELERLSEHVDSSAPANGATVAASVGSD